ncbi:hypothetical protein [Chryseobacterium sp. MYb328]|uniref:hypothetical protein n=1 Tax=Chryseobacterium sp. MYb328 TaxID=2745231 RepID=UPI003098FBE8
MKALKELTADIREKLPESESREIVLSDLMFIILVHLSGNNEVNIYKLTHEWTLSKPFLKDQSPELINFLHGLIKK